MVDRPGAAGATALARQHPALAVGLHLDADDVDLDDPRAAERAFERQLARFRALLGRDPTHVDSHHHVHRPAARLAVITRLAAPLGIPVRFDGRVAHLDGFHGRGSDGTAAPGRITPQALLAVVGQGTEHGWCELGCHPGRVSNDLRSGYETERETELATLTTPGLREELAARGIELTSFAEVPTASG